MLESPQMVAFTVGKVEFSGQLIFREKEFELSVGPGWREKLPVTKLSTEFTVDMKLRDGQQLRGQWWITGIGSKLTGMLSELETHQFLSDGAYFRLLVPLSENISLRDYLMRNSFQSDIMEGADSFCVDLAGYIWHVCIVRDTQLDVKEYYLAIDCFKIMTADEFISCTSVIRNALGYLTGHLAADRGYVFCYQDEAMKAFSGFRIIEYRASILSAYTPFNSRVSAYANHCPFQKAFDESRLRKFTRNHFSTLCKVMMDKPEVNHAIVLIQEASVASLLFMPGGLAIALESLSKALVPDIDEALAVIRSPDIRKQLQSEIMEVIDKYKEDVDYDVLRSRVMGELYKPTNATKLKAPFNYWGIPLLKEDLDVLRMRNDLLHGRVPEVKRKCPVSDPGNPDLYYVAMRLYTLLNMLLMKVAGFDGLVLNHAMIHEAYCRAGISESMYRSLDGSFIEI